MKLTIATGILVGQTLSVTSDESPATNSGVDFVVDSSAFKKKELLTTTKAVYRQERTGTKARTDSSLFHRSGNKPLMNRTPLPDKKKFLCDPSLQDADIGMLSCGLGYECIADEFSTLGGVCTPSTSRQLQENNNCVLCPFGFTLGKESYDIIIDDTESGYGGKTCESTIDPAYYSNLIPDESSCNALASVVQAAGCCVPKCELCDRRSYMGSPDKNTVVVDGISLPGYDVVTCQILSVAGYVQGAIELENCPASRQAAIDAGCCVAAQCLTCEPGSYIPPSENSTTCYDLTLSQLTYGVNNTFDEENCLANTQLAEDEGCCTPIPIYNECNICGDATFYADNTVFRQGTCEYIQPLVNAEDCVTYDTLLVTSCCGPAAAPAEDTDAPAPTPASTDAPAPTPASSAMWSTGPVVVSMMCLTTSTLTVGGWFLGLN